MWLSISGITSSDGAGTESADYGSWDRGHVFPALSIADCLLKRGAEVHWLATRSGMEK